MGKGGALDAGTLRAHAAQVSTLHIRLGRVATVFRGLEWNDESFGSQPGWIAAAIGRRTTRQLELIEYVAENFELIAEDLWHNLEEGPEKANPARWAGRLPSRSGRDDDAPPGIDPVVLRDHRIAARPTQRFSGLRDRILAGNWIDALLAEALPGTAPTPAAPAPAVDPFAALPAAGLDWLLPRLEPLRGLVDGLTGDPELVTAQAATLQGGAADLHAACTDLQQMLRGVLAWPGLDVDSYLDLMANNVDALAGLVGTATALAVAAEAAGTLVGWVRDVVGGLLDELAAQVIVLAGAGQDVALVAPALVEAITGCRQQALQYISALVSSLTELAVILEG